MHPKYYFWRGGESGFTGYWISLIDTIMLNIDPAEMHDQKIVSVNGRIDKLVNIFVNSKIWKPNLQHTKLHC